MGGPRSASIDSRASWPARRAALPALAALSIAGCFSDRGLSIEVDVGKTNATSVELFIGKAACDASTAGIDCMSIAPPIVTDHPPDGTIPLTGSIWFRDDDARFSAPVVGHTAIFQLRANPTDPTVAPQIIVAVGSLDDGSRPSGVGTATLHGLSIPTDTARVITTTLQPATAVVEGQITTATEDHVQVWTKQTPPSSCVVVEHWANGSATRDFVVPSDDPDCDDVMQECNPTAYHGSIDNSSGVANCAFNSVVPPAGACELGAAMCSDDFGPKDCGPLSNALTTCVPSQVCPCSENIQSCVKALTADAMNGGIAENIPHIDCKLPTIPAKILGPCSRNGELAEVNLNTVFQSQCDSVQIGTLGAFGDSVTLAGPGLFSRDGPVMTVDNPSGEHCVFQITWQAGSPASDLEFALIQLHSVTGNELLVPVAFHFTGQCLGDTKVQCDVHGTTDTLWSCSGPKPL